MPWKVDGSFCPNYGTPKVAFGYGDSFEFRRGRAYRGDGRVTVENS